MGLALASPGAYWYLTIRFEISRRNNLPTSGDTKWSRRIAQGTMTHCHQLLITAPSPLELCKGHYGFATTSCPSVCIQCQFAVHADLDFDEDGVDISSWNGSCSNPHQVRKLKYLVKIGHDNLRAANNLMDDGN